MIIVVHLNSNMKLENVSAFLQMSCMPPKQSSKTKTKNVPRNIKVCRPNNHVKQIKYTPELIGEVKTLFH